MNSPAKLRAIDFIWTHTLSNYITDAAWSPQAENSRLAVASVSGELAVYEGRNGRDLFFLPNAHEEGIDAVAWRPDGGAIATAGRDGAWRLWKAETGALLAEHEPGPLWVEQAAWSPEPVAEWGHVLAIGAGNQVTLWNSAGEKVGEPIKLPKTVADLAWLPGAILAIATSTAISQHDPKTGASESVFAAKDPVLKMSFSPSAKWLMTGTQDNGVHVWNCDNGMEMHMRGFATKVRNLAWHKGSRWLATGGGDTIAVWDCSGRGPEGRTPVLLEWHTDAISALEYQRSGDWLASGAKDGGVAVWSPTLRNSLVTGAKIPSAVTKVLWSSDGKRLAVTGEGGEVQVVEIGP